MLAMGPALIYQEAYRILGSASTRKEKKKNQKQRRGLIGNNSCTKKSGNADEKRGPPIRKIGFPNQHARVRYSFSRDNRKLFGMQSTPQKKCSIEEKRTIIFGLK